MLLILVLIVVAVMLLRIQGAEHFNVAKSGKRAEATYHYYENNDGPGNSGACDTACADKFCVGGKVIGSWKKKLQDKKLPWTAVNMKMLKFPTEDSTKFIDAGMCGRVVTIRKGSRSKDFRIVDTKGGPGFDLAGKAFKEAGLNHAAGKDVVDWKLK